MMTFLNNLFYELDWNQFQIASADLEKYFNNSLVKLVEYFSTNYFQTYWNEIMTDIIYIERIPLEKEISPEEIFSIVNGAKPLVIEWDVRIWTKDEDVPDYKTHEVWLK